MQKILCPLALILPAFALTACKSSGGGGPSAPLPPAALQINAGNAQITAQWQPVKGATQYNLYYARQSFASLRNPPSGHRTLRGGAMVPNITATSHTLTGLNNGDTYYFVLTAKNRSGESKISKQISATPGGAGVVFRDALKDGGQGPQMVALPTGSFSMGSPTTEANRDRDEGPVRTVTISKRIAIGKYEVTFADYDRFADAHSSRSRPSDSGWGRGTRPVIHVNWNEAKAYAAWLSVQTGKPYRLPSEAEWEYAARAGTSTRYSWGDSITCSQASYSRFSGGSCNTDRNAGLARTVAAGSFAANPFGLHDMHGNVWEWVEDCYVNTYTGAPSDGSARTTGCGTTTRADVRGGSWDFDARYLRSANRSRDMPTVRLNNVGFRLVQDLNP